MRDLISGARAFAQGARFLFARPRLWVWAAAPAGIALLILAGVIWAVSAWTSPLIASAVEFLPDAIERWFAGALRLLLVVLLGLGGYVVFMSLTALVSAPFNEMLSEAAEREVTGAAARRFSPLRLAREIATGIAHATRRVAIYLLTLAVLLLVGLLVPAVGPLLAMVGGAIATARFAAYDAFDAGWARKGWSYADKIAWLRAHPGARYGLGGATATLGLVPVANVLALPIGAVGATLAFLESEQRAAPRPAH